MHRLDCTSLKCPLPLLKLKVALVELASGDEIELLATDPVSCRDIPKFCQKTGHQLIESTDTPVFCYRIKKA